MNARPKKASPPPPQPDRLMAIAGSKANEVADEIRQRILSGALTQGQRLPTEDALAVEYKVSRTTIRDTLRILQLSGFVRRASLRIVVVSRPTDEVLHREVRRALVRHGATLHDVHEAILALSPAIAALAAKRATAEDIAELREILKIQEKSRSDATEFSEYFNKFTEKIDDISRSPALILLRGPLRHLVLSVSDFSVDDSLIERIKKRQYRIVDDIEARDDVSASHMIVMQAIDFREIMESKGIDYSAEVESLTDIS